MFDPLEGLVELELELFPECGHPHYAEQGDEEDLLGKESFSRNVGRDQVVIGEGVQEKDHDEQGWEEVNEHHCL